MDVLGFLVWHYGEGLEIFASIWYSYFRLVFHYFSLPLLIKTLFSPWKRLTDFDSTPGFDPGRYLEAIAFNIISRGIGAIVRISLFIVGIILLGITSIVGLLGLASWVIVPFLGIPIYSRTKKNPQSYIQAILATSPSNDKVLKTVFSSEAGMEFLSRLGLEKEILIDSAKVENIEISPEKIDGLESLISLMLSQNVWSEDFLNKIHILPEDLTLAASLWDKRRESESEIEKIQVGTPGVGLELMFGYTPTLNKTAEDMSTPRAYSHHLIGREQIVSRMERVLNGGSNVMLSGRPGVGKKTVVLEFAYRARTGQLGQVMAYRRVMYLDQNALLSGTKDINEKKKLITDLFNEAANAGNIILVIKDIHRLASKEVEGFDFTDILEDLLSKDDLKVIAITTPVDYERFVAPNMRLRKHFEYIEANPPNLDEAMQILVESALRWEKLKNVTITIPALRKILIESDRYITDTPFPEKALELLDDVVLAVEQKNEDTVAVSDVDSVFSERTGIPSESINESEKDKLRNLEKTIHESLVNQENAVNLIAKSLRSKTVAGSSQKKPIGSFLFLGPTGVGKTETAKVLARVYYGSEKRIIRFDMAEFAGKEGFERLIGNVSSNQPGALTNAIKNNPASLLLLDEIEKATPPILNLFLRLLDEGVMTDAFGNEILGRHLFIVGTSNAGAEFIRQAVGNGSKNEKLQESVVDEILKKDIFAPEFINRFDGVVVYEPLTPEHLRKVARLMLEKFSIGLRENNIYLQITDEICEKLANDGYDPAFGARPMERIVKLDLGDVFGKALLDGTIESGDVVEIVPTQDDYTLSVVSSKK